MVLFLLEKRPLYREPTAIPGRGRRQRPESGESDPDRGTPLRAPGPGLWRDGDAPREKPASGRR